MSRSWWASKHQRDFKGFDDKILSMYARGMSTREIRAQLEEIYNVQVSPDLISRVTDEVVSELKAWQDRPLEPIYMIVYLDAMVVKIRDKGVVQNKSVALTHSFRTLRPRVGALFEPTERGYTPARMTYDLRRLRLKGLIQRMRALGRVRSRDVEDMQRCRRIVAQAEGERYGPVALRSA